MSRNLGLFSCISLTIIGFPVITQSQTNLYLAYPPAKHTTEAKQIFFIGSAPAEGEVMINGQVVSRSEKGYFAPSFPLEIGENKFTLTYGNETIERVITRLDTQPQIPEGLAFGEDSLTPRENITRLKDEIICFEAIAPSQATVTVTIANQTIPLFPQVNQRELLPNWVIYTPESELNPPRETSIYKGCTSFSEIGFLGHPVYKLNIGDRQLVKSSPSHINIIPPHEGEIVEIISDRAVTRTGPNTNYSRLTPLPKGTRAKITGKEGEWLRLDYGAWVKESETQIISHAIPPQSLIRSIKTREVKNSTEIIFPLEVPVPVAIQQEDENLTITLHNAIAQTDTIRFDDHPWLKRLDWQQITPNQVEYTLHFKSQQQWGYNYRYEDDNLIVSVKHPPLLSSQRILPLQNITIVLDPGHGGKESGSLGPTGYPEKEINLLISQLLAQKLTAKGATVYLTREKDVEMSLEDRVKFIEEKDPAIALSIHYNALPDGGDALNTMGVSTFWYHPQAHSLAVFIHNYLVKELNRPDYGVYWNNLALTRTHYVPTVLLELGFMINPVEFTWITNPEEQNKLVESLSEAIVLWFESQ